MRPDAVLLSDLLRQAVVEVLKPAAGGAVPEAQPTPHAVDAEGPAASIDLATPAGPALRLRLLLSQPLAQALCAPMGPAVGPADVASEWANLLGGRLAMRLAEAGIACRLGLPRVTALATATSPPATEIVRQDWTCDGLPFTTILQRVIP